MNFFNRLFNKRIIAIVLVVCLSASGILTGCKKDEETDNYVVKVGDEKLYMDEAIWFLYLTEKELKNDADKYYEENGTSFWNVAYDDANTVADMIKSNVISRMAYYEILSNEAERTGRYEIEDQGGYSGVADIMMEELTPELKEKGLTKETYEEILAKIHLSDLYYADAIELYDVDEDKIREDNPYDKSTYDSKESYESHIKELIEANKKEKFNDDYNVLLENIYGVSINYDIWDTVKVGELADLMDTSLWNDENEDIDIDIK